MTTSTISGNCDSKTCSETAKRRHGKNKVCLRCYQRLQDGGPLEGPYLVKRKLKAERTKKALALQAKGMFPAEIAKKLKVNTRTIQRDLEAAS
jgi:DNA invertase Pin-like site-specific DNA recombinase